MADRVRSMKGVPRVGVEILGGVLAFGRHVVGVLAALWVLSFGQRAVDDGRSAWIVWPLATGAAVITACLLMGGMYVLLRRYALWRFGDDVEARRRYMDLYRRGAPPRAFDRTGRTR